MNNSPARGPAPVATAWEAAYPGEDLSSEVWDILDWGYWTDDGTYEAAVIRPVLA